MDIDYIITGSKNDFEQCKIYKLDLACFIIMIIIGAIEVI